MFIFYSQGGGGGDLIFWEDALLAGCREIQIRDLSGQEYNK